MGEGEAEAQGLGGKRAFDLKSELLDGGREADGMLRILEKIVEIQRGVDALKTVIESIIPSRVAQTRRRPNLLTRTSLYIVLATNESCRKIRCLCR